MPPLYVVTQGAKLRIRKKRLCIELDDVLTSLPVNHVSQVNVFGNIGLTTPAITRLLSENVEVVFHTQRGAYKGRLCGSISPHVPLRKQQYACQEKADFCLAVAKDIVKAKIRHQRALLRRNWEGKKEQQAETVFARMDMSLQALPGKKTLNSVRGIEGTAGAAYFKGYKTCFSDEWDFGRRNRRPPRDPINVLLSFGYTLITQIAVSAVRSAGLDVYAGFLHSTSYNRPSMALDLVEEFRPVIDGLVLWCCRSEYIKVDQFKKGTDRRPVLLNDSGQKKFLGAFEKRMQKRYTHPIRQQRISLRQCIFEQARQMAACVREVNPDFTPMGFR